MALPSAADGARSTEFLRLCRVVGLLISLFFLGLYATHVQLKDGYLRDAARYVVGIDFVNAWMMGRAGLQEESPERNYHIETYTKALRATVRDPEYTKQQWSYPPNYMALMLPFGALSYLAAWIIFLSASLASLVWVIRHCCASEWNSAVISVVSMPATLVTLLCGQIALLASAAQLFLLRNLDRRPLLSGFLLGLLTIKPHLGLVYPLYLIATKRWRVIAAAAVTAIALVLLSAGLFGVEMWTEYLTRGIPLQAEILHYPPPNIVAMMPTIYMDVKMLGASHAVSMGAQILAAILAIFALMRAVRQQQSMERQMLLLATANLLATPYLMAYDLLFFTLSLVFYAKTHALDRVGFWIFLASFWLPILHFVAAIAGVSGTALAPVLLVGHLMRRDDNATGLRLL